MAESQLSIGCHQRHDARICVGMLDLLAPVGMLGNREHPTAPGGTWCGNMEDRAGTGAVPMPSVNVERRFRGCLGMAPGLGMELARRVGAREAGEAGEARGCEVYGGCMEGVWRVYGGCMEGLWRVGRVGRVCGGCAEGVGGWREKGESGRMPGEEVCRGWRV